MSRRLWRLLAILVVGCQLVRAAPASPEEPNGPRPSSEEIMKARTQVERELARLHAGGARVRDITDDPVVRAFPAFLFVSVVFPRFPVAALVPAPLAVANVYAVSRAGDRRQLLTDVKGLEAFFRSYMGRVRDDGAARDAVRAWLLLAVTFSQDGYSKFVLQDDSTKVTTGPGGRTAHGRAVVMKGGNGDITAALTFDAAGTLVDVSHRATVTPGPRPICQATKLLDPDSVVRRMAEDDLMFMGRAAREYLAAQRARAGPGLQRAIDRLWKRIVEDERRSEGPR